jgi:hypothetical protein
MGRNKKVKTPEEQEQYKEKRRIQNRINQRNFRKRRKNSYCECL